MLKKELRTGVISVVIASLFSVSVVSQAAADPITWRSTAVPESNNWTSVTYGGGLFVAVSDGEGDGSGVRPSVMTSTNGTAWTPIPSAPKDAWKSVTYGTVDGEGRFVAVSYAGTNRVMTSPDGIIWSPQVAPLNAWSSVTYGNDLFVAVGISAGADVVMTSPDGIIWSPQEAPENAWNSVTYGNGRFVAVGNKDNEGSTAIMTSPNGINWTVPTTEATDSDWTSVTYGNGRFVAVAYNGTTNRVMTSINGTAWTSRSAPLNAWFSVTYGTGLFVAVSAIGLAMPAAVMTSPDGINWTSQVVPLQKDWMSVTYGNGAFVAVANDYSGQFNQVMLSTAVVSPPVFTLTASTESRTVNTVATGFNINSTGGAVTSFAINATPPGMSFNTTTGALTGTPNIVAPATTYTITATNAAGPATQTFTLTVTAAPVSADNSAAQAAAAQAAAQAAAAKQQRELTEILSIIPSLGSLALNLGETTKALTLQKCVKKKQIKYVKKGAKCPKGFVRKR
jgi:hypothetical protein